VAPLLLICALIFLAEIGRILLGLVQDGQSMEAMNWFNYAVNLTATVTVLSSCLLWGLNRLPTAVLGALAVAALTGGQVYRDDYVLVGKLLSWHASIFVVLLVAGLLSAVRLLLSSRTRTPYPKYACWAGGALLGLLLLAERDLISTSRLIQWYWLSSAYPEPFDLSWDLAQYPTDFLSSSFGIAGALFVIVLLRIIYNVVVWDEGIASPGARAKVLYLAGFVFFMPADWVVNVWGWPVPIWIFLLPLTIIAFSAFRSVLDTLQDDGRTLRAHLFEIGIDQLNGDANRWRAAVREGRAADKLLAQGNIGLSAYRGETNRISQELAESARRLQPGDTDQSRSMFTPMDVLLSVGPTLSPLENAKFAAKTSALWCAPFAVLLIGVYWPGEDVMIYSSSYVLVAVFELVWVTLSFVACGAVIGLVWHHLPGRRGPIRVLPLVALYAIAPILELAYSYFSETKLSAPPIVEVLSFLGVATFVGLAMDWKAVRKTRPPWQRRLHALAVAYGAENVPAQLAFFLAQASAIIAVITFIHNGMGADTNLPGGTSSTSQPQH
jgi:hypothetical protein